jgi:hypothetical protein
MINIAVFEDDSFYHTSAKRILSKVFEGQTVNIEIYSHWTKFEEENSTPKDKPLHYVFLDDNLGRDSNGRFVHGDRVKKNLEVMGYNPSYIGISNLKQDYLSINIGKFPGESSMGWKSFDEKHLTDESINELRLKICPDLF